MTGSVRPRTASLLVGAAGALALTAALSGCASSDTKPTGSGVGTVSVTVNSPSAASSPSAPASPTSASSAPAPATSPSALAPTTSAGGGTVGTPKQVLGTAPAGAKLVSFDDITASADGRTLFVELESMGGACGQYDVVLQQSASAVKVGLVHLSSGGHVCPQFVGPMRITVSLAAPLAGRPVVDLSDGQSLKVG